MTTSQNGKYVDPPTKYLRQDQYLNQEKRAQAQLLPFVQRAPPVARERRVVV